MCTDWSWFFSSSAGPEGPEFQWEWRHEQLSGHSENYNFFPIVMQKQKFRFKGKNTPIFVNFYDDMLRHMYTYKI